MNQKTIIVILGVIVVILLGTTIYFAKINNSNQTVFTQPNKDVPAEWKTYENKEYGFMLKYPNKWTVSNRDINTYGGILNLAFRSLENQKLIDQAQTEIDEGGFNPGAGDAYYFNNNIEIAIFNKKPIVDNDPVDIIIGETTLGGEKATEYWMGGYGSNYGLVVENNGIFFKFEFKGCGTDECIKNRELSSNVKQILNNFKFTK